MPQKIRLLAATCLMALAVAAWPQEALAQRRAVRRPASRTTFVVSRFHHPAFYDPFFFYRPFFYSPFYFGWYAHYPYPPYRYRFPLYDRTGSARIRVTPREAQVYVDGYFVGLVDDFDGVFQRLHVEAGEHELQIYLEGYRTFRQKVLFTPGTTPKIAHTMEPLGPGESNEPRPQPDAAQRAQQAPGPRESRQYGREQRAGFGTLSLRVQPPDATVLIDGEEWERPSGENRFVVDLPEGPHQVEVRKDGYQTYARSIQVRRGRTVTLNVSLTSGAGKEG